MNAEPSRLTGRLLSVAGERSLGARLLARDERALTELIEIATPWLLGITQSMLSDRDEAEEVVQEAFGIIWNRIHLLDPAQGGLIPWLLRITRNRAIDRLRARKRRRSHLERLGSLTSPAETVTPAAEPNEAVHPGWHVHETVHAALTGLPDDQREAVRLAYFEGLTHSEIAERLGIPMGTVKTRLRLAFDKLRIALATIKDWVV
ncbi:MAG: sigma-70 family RNA polymerase sigma factor [Gemmatimonadota bacterium]